MKIITYYSTLDLKECQDIYFDYDRAMITFYIDGLMERLFFASQDKAIKFMNEIMEGIYSGSPLVDVSYITAIPGKLKVELFMHEVNERIKNYKSTK